MNSNRTFNQVMLAGFVGKDPEARHFPDGGAITTFSLSTSSSYKNREGNYVDQVEWHRIVCRGKLAEFVQKNVKAKRHVLVRGEIHYRSYTDKDGQEKQVTEIQCDELQALDRKDSAAMVAGGGDAPSSAGSGKTQANQRSSERAVNKFEEGMPF